MSAPRRDPEAGAAADRVTIRLTHAEVAGLADLASKRGVSRARVLVDLLRAALAGVPSAAAPVLELTLAPDEPAEVPAAPVASSETPTERDARARREARVQAVWDRHLRQHPELARALAAAEEAT